MNTYVIKNLETMKFVSPSGSEQSYTSRLQNARRFTTRESAEQDACGNEIVLTLEQAMTS